MTRHTAIPKSHPVQPCELEEAKAPATCGHCGLTWDDAISTGLTPAPAARCPFEPFHTCEDEEPTPLVAPEDLGTPKAGATFARATLDYFRDLVGGDEENDVRDLLADIMHHCAATGLDFDYEVGIARRNYHDELAERTDREQRS